MTHNNLSTSSTEKYFEPKVSNSFYFFKPFFNVVFYKTAFTPCR
ncbi:hypothetical protein HMPREF9069_00254 [Atopobium sp. oral taxon 810 str. F0209]|nr:hypothetical protein HMPREF9069_00254 [Atopobium sp. oral taxon 810 str. F0209]